MDYKITDEFCNSLNAVILIHVFLALPYNQIRWTINNQKLEIEYKIVNSKIKINSFKMLYWHKIFKTV